MEVGFSCFGLSERVVMKCSRAAHGFCLNSVDAAQRIPSVHRLRSSQRIISPMIVDDLRSDFSSEHSRETLIRSEKKHDTFQQTPSDFLSRRCSHRSSARVASKRIFLFLNTTAFAFVLSTPQHVNGYNICCCRTTVQALLWSIDQPTLPAAHQTFRHRTLAALC